MIMHARVVHRCPLNKKLISAIYIFIIYLTVQITSVLCLSKKSKVYHRFAISTRQDNLSHHFEIANYVQT